MLHADEDEFKQSVVWACASIESMSLCCESTLILIAFVALFFPEDMNDPAYYCILIAFFIKLLIVNWHAYVKISICCMVPHVTVMMWLKVSDLLPHFVSTCQAIYFCSAFGYSETWGYVQVALIFLFVDAIYNLCKSLCGFVLCPIWIYWSYSIFKDEDNQWISEHAFRENVNP